MPSSKRTFLVILLAAGAMVLDQLRRIPRSVRPLVALGAALAVLFLGGVAVAAGSHPEDQAYIDALYDGTSLVYGTDDELLAQGHENCRQLAEVGKNALSNARMAESVQYLCPDLSTEYETYKGEAARDAAEAEAKARIAAEKAQAEARVNVICWADWANVDPAYQGAVLHYQNTLNLSTPDGTGNTYKRNDTLDDVTVDEIRNAVATSCPEHQSTLDAIDAEVAKWDSGLRVGSGSFVVGSGEGQMQPGTWHTTSTSILEGCYWERTDSTGDIVDNYFSNAASHVVVTVRAGETFNSNDCGGWEHS